MNRCLLPLLCLLTTLAMACPAEGPIAQPDGGGTDDGGMQGGDASAPDEDAEAIGLELASLEPTEGPASGGTEVTLSGTGFADGMTVRFGTTAPLEATVVSDTEATVTTPASTASGAVTVVVSNADGESSSLLNGFRFIGEDDVVAIDFCQLQAQSPISATTGVPTEGIYAVVFAEGITGGAGQGAGIEGELGYGTGDDASGFDYVPMAYNVDKDGLTAGDLANDEYGAPLAIPVAGTYRYAARFRTTVEGSDWTYCDLGGSDDGVTADQLGTIEVTDPVVPTVGFCSTSPWRVLGVAGSAVTFEGTAFVAGATPGAGAAPDLVGELVWREASASGSTWSNTEAATYTADVDGLSAGDLANDRWTASFTPAQSGAYAVAFRFSADGGTTWTLCDIDGSSEADPFTEIGAAVLEVTDAAATKVDFCHVFQTDLDVMGVQPPPLVTVELYDAPATEGNGGANSAAFTAEVGYGAVAANPALDGAYTWTSMPYKGLRDGHPNNYEYESGAWAAGMQPAAGTYRVAVRVRHEDDAVWTYCDTDDSADGFRLDAATNLVVAP